MQLKHTDSRIHSASQAGKKVSSLLGAVPDLQRASQIEPTCLRCGSKLTKKPLDSVPPWYKQQCEACGHDMGVVPSPSEASPPPRCPRCGGFNLLEDDGCGPHHRKLVCADCNRFAGWKPKAMDLGRAQEHRLSFGCHRRRKVGRLATNHGGCSYLRWMVRTLDGDRYRRDVAAAEMVLANIENRGAGQ